MLPFPSFNPPCQTADALRCIISLLLPVSRAKASILRRPRRVHSENHSVEEHLRRSAPCTATAPALPLMKHEERCDHDECEAHRVIPREFVPQVKHGEHWKDGERDDLLNRLKLRRRELVGADAVRGHLKAVFKKRDPP